MKRTRLGKIVGSYKPPLQDWTYWYQDGRWSAVAPSGARMKGFDNEREAAEYAAARNREDANA